MIRFDMGPLIVTPAVAATIWEIFDSDLEPVKKLQSAALLLDFWLGQGVRAAAIPAAVLAMLCIALRAVSPEQRRPSQKDTQPYGRE